MLTSFECQQKRFRDRTRAGGSSGRADPVPRPRRAADAAYGELVATRVSHQRQGHATALIRRLAAEIRRYEIGALSPSDPFFYERLGWERWRGALLVQSANGIEATPDAALMALRLPRTPPDLDLSASLAVDWRPGEVW